MDNEIEPPLPLDLPEQPVTFGEREGYYVRLATGDFHESPARQVRAMPDPELVAEYAEAMLEGAEFPPIVVFEDEAGARHLADGLHRTYGAALAALKDPTRKPEVLAEVRRGSYADALRHALRANQAHGKRMTEADYKRAILTALAGGLVQVPQATDVPAALVALVGCSIRMAQVASIDYRRDMVAKRDRLILAMHAEGKTQAAIGEALDVSHQTVGRVLASVVQKRSVAVLDKPARPAPPKAELPDPEEFAPPKPAPKAKAAEGPPRYASADVRAFLPLMARIAPLPADETAESGAVGALPDPPTAEREADPAAVKALAVVVRELERCLKALGGLAGLEKPSTEAVAARALATIETAEEFLGELATYIKEGTKL